MSQGNSSGAAATKMDGHAYATAMRRLRTSIAITSSLLLALIARTLIDGLNFACGLAGAVTSVALLTSVGLWHQGRRLAPIRRRPGVVTGRSLAGPPRSAAVKPARRGRGLQ